MADLVIREGTVVDGTGRRPPTVADVAVTGGRITGVGRRLDERGDRELDAEGHLVTPGFVDVHTHYDGQATWDPELGPSSWHGVTSVVMGNCGVGFAPALPTDADHEWLIGLLEGVEDIPGTALAEGLTWDWERFPDYLDALARRRFAMDIGAQVGHAPLRAYVMGERGADPDAVPTPDELAAMADHVKASLLAGAIGFTTSRTELHKTRDGAPLGTRHSSVDELLAIVSALRETGLGVVQLISDAYLSADEGFVKDELQLMRALAEATGRPLSMSVQQHDRVPDRWREMLDFVGACADDGLTVRAQVAPRPIGVLEGLEASVHPFVACRSYQEVAGLPLDERVRALADPERRRRILAEHAASDQPLRDALHAFHKIFPLTDPVDYEPSPDASLAGIAAREGRTPAEVAYDLLLEDEGHRLLYLPLFNWSHGDLEDVRGMLTDPHAMVGLSDGGAHCGAICDASFPTTALAHWSRDRQRGEQLPIERIVHLMTQRTAAHVGWLDRGVVAPGYLADLNVVDHAGLALHPPRIIRDLPAGGRRLVQRADGYRWTVKAGVVTFADGEPTGETPGHLVRGARPTPA